MKSNKVDTCIDSVNSHALSVLLKALRVFDAHIYGGLFHWPARILLRKSFLRQVKVKSKKCAERAMKSLS